MILLILKKYFILILDFLKNKTVKTSKLKPTTNLKDVFNKNLRICCYNRAGEKHLGIYFYTRITFNSDEVNFFQSYYILFDMILKQKRIMKSNGIY